jgi:putative DNA primase/helicase
MIDAPQNTNRIRAVPEALLARLADSWNEPSSNGKPTKPHDGRSSNNGDYQSRLKVEEWLKDRSVGYKMKPKEASHGRTVYLLETCPFDPSHGATNEVCIMQDAKGKMSARCMHNSCSGRGWQDFKRAIGLPEAHHYDPPLVPKKSIRKSKKAIKPPAAAAGEPVASGDYPPGQYPNTDYGNAQRMRARHGSNLRYCYAWSKALVWDTRRWGEDDTGAMERQAKETVRSIYGEAEKAKDKELREALAKWAVVSEDAKHIRAMMGLVRSEPGIAVRPRDLDQGRFLLNVVNGTLNLQTGELRDHCLGDHITKLAPVRYDAKAACPLWDRFLDRIMAGNTDLIDFLRRAVGYSLTGSVAEQCLFLLYGTGANGKSTFLSALLAMLGDYAIQGVSELLMSRGHDTHPTEKADLFGRRLVSCVEYEEGRRMAESLMKQLTGGDAIRARRMREDFWQFWPTHKLFIAVNHKPIVRGTDYAVWRRIKLVPFEVTIPDEEKDRHLLDKLKRELPGILAWAVRGCMEWQQHGLGEPDEVRQATADYRGEMDALMRFVAERCVQNSEVRCTLKQMFAAYAKWAAEGGEEVFTRQAFNTKLRERGFRDRNSAANGAAEWHGIGLLRN